MNTMDKYMDKMLEKAAEIVAEADRASSKIGPIGEYAVVEKIGNVIHLQGTCNAGDECYTIESYGHNGWYARLPDLTEDNFWDVWDIWNGHVSGSVCLEDHDYPDEVDCDLPAWDEEIGRHREVSLAELVDCPDGIYTVMV